MLESVMPVARYNNEFGIWLEELYTRHGIKSSRQATPRVGIAHTTLEDIRKGRQPTVETAIRIARGFNEDIEMALRLAGHHDIADAWEQGAGKTERDDQADEEPEYDPNQDDPKVMAYYNGLPDYVQEDVKAQLEALWKRHQKDQTTHGKKAE
jgi:plasmid maintenance system antidote protein VapI